jgi:carboxylesterase type B
MIMNAWVRFVSTGNPNGGDVTGWPVYDVSTDPYFAFDIRPEVAHGLRLTQLDFIGRVQRASKH